MYFANLGFGLAKVVLALRLTTPLLQGLRCNQTKPVLIYLMSILSSIYPISLEDQPSRKAAAILRTVFAVTAPFTVQSRYPAVPDRTEIASQPAVAHAALTELNGARLWEVDDNDSQLSGPYRGLEQS